MFIFLILILVLAITMRVVYKPIHGGKRDHPRGGKRSNKFSRFDISEYIDYPFTNKWVSEEELRETFEDLKNFDMKPVIKNAEVPLGLLELDKYPERMIVSQAFITGDKFEKLVDYFQEPVRSKCNRRGFPSSYKNFYDPSASWKWAKKYKDIAPTWDEPPSPKLWKEIATDMRATIKHDCDLMAAGMIKKLINEFVPHHILMPTGGWGDAIIASLASDIERLTAVDPHEAAVKNWEKMLEFYQPQFPSDSVEVDFIVSPFQTAEIPIIESSDVGYDMIYSSPPYFVSEEYGKDRGQSYLSNPALDDWIENFLIFSFNKAWATLRSGGHMAIALNDIWYEGEPLHFVERFHDWMETVEDAEYLTTWAFKKYEHHSKYQPIFIWRKK